jgi:hypothetical protein
LKEIIFDLTIIVVSIVGAEPIRTSPSDSSYNVKVFTGQCPEKELFKYQNFKKNKFLEDTSNITVTPKKINLDESALEEEWPIPPPVSFSTPDGFSQMLEDASNYNINPKMRRGV